MSFKILSSTKKMLSIVILLIIKKTALYSQGNSSSEFSVNKTREINLEIQELMKAESYNAALPKLESLHKKNPEVLLTNYQLGLCYLNTQSNYSLAIQHLKSASLHQDSPKDALYFLGMAYLADKKIDEAKEAFQKYISAGKGKSDLLLYAEHQIEMCDNAVELMKNPVNVTIKNLGKQINSTFSDYNPYVSPDESSLIFTSRRKTNLGGIATLNNDYPSDIYISSNKDGIWSKAKNAGGLINSMYDDECVSLTHDGNQILLFIDNMDSYGDIFTSGLKGTSWQRPVSIDKSSLINTKDYETGACISPDGNTLIFSSNKIKDSYGGFDLYISRKLPNCEWGLPQNLGAVINTKYDEESPNFFADGLTLFFSSNGHNSMGGMDMFRTKYDNLLKQWSKPENLGYPVNTCTDNNSFSITADGKFAYVSAIDENTNGNLDIYKITYNDIDIPGNYSVIKGVIDPLDIASTPNIEITLSDNSQNELLGIYSLNRKTGKFIIIANPGEYLMNINIPGYLPYKEELHINESFYPVEILKKINFTKK